MATIYRATDTGLGRDVALKLLRPEYLRDPDFSSRFRQEAQAAASLSHPNVVTVYDYGEDPSGPYIVMELVDGEDLATILRRSGALPPRQVARIGAGVARALAAAHARGLVHRDIKPGNVLIGRDGQVKVVDFGIARAIAEAQMTLPGTTLGSVHYFSPEQARGEPATAASDIYSLGHRPVRDAHRRPAVGGRQRRVGRARPPVRPDPRPDGRPAVRPARPRRDHPARPCPRPDDRFGLGLGHGRCARGHARARWRCGCGDDGAAAAGAAGAAAAGAAAGPVPPAGPRRRRPRTLASARSEPRPAGAVVGAAVSGTARPNPGGIPYRPDAYADTSRGRPGSGGERASTARPATRTAASDPRSERPARWSGSPASSPSSSSRSSRSSSSSSRRAADRPAEQVTVPQFVGPTSTQASTPGRRRSGSTLTSTGVASPTSRGHDPDPGPAAGTEGRRRDARSR